MAMSLNASLPNEELSTPSSSLVCFEAFSTASYNGGFKGSAKDKRRFFEKIVAQKSASGIPQPIFSRERHKRIRDQPPTEAVDHLVNCSNKEAINGHLLQRNQQQKHCQFFIEQPNGVEAEKAIIQQEEYKQQQALKRKREQLQYQFMRQQSQEQKRAQGESRISKPRVSHTDRPLRNRAEMAQTFDKSGIPVPCNRGSPERPKRRQLSLPFQQLIQQNLTQQQQEINREQQKASKKQIKQQLNVPLSGKQQSKNMTTITQPQQPIFLVDYQYQQQNNEKIKVQQHNFLHFLLEQQNQQKYSRHEQMFNKRRASQPLLSSAQHRTVELSASSSSLAGMAAPLTARTKTTPTRKRSKKSTSLSAINQMSLADRQRHFNDSEIAIENASILANITCASATVSISLLRKNYVLHSIVIVEIPRCSCITLHVFLPRKKEEKPFMPGIISKENFDDVKKEKYHEVVDKQQIFDLNETFENDDICSSLNSEIIKNQIDNSKPTAMVKSFSKANKTANIFRQLMEPIKSCETFILAEIFNRKATSAHAHICTNFSVIVRLPNVLEAQQLCIREPKQEKKKKAKNELLIIESIKTIAQIFNVDQKCKAYDPMIDKTDSIFVQRQTKNILKCEDSPKKSVITSNTAKSLESKKTVQEASKLQQCLHTENTDCPNETATEIYLTETPAIASTNLQNIPQVNAISNRKFIADDNSHQRVFAEAEYWERKWLYEHGINIDRTRLGSTNKRRYSLDDNTGENFEENSGNNNRTSNNKDVCNKEMKQSVQKETENQQLQQKQNNDDNLTTNAVQIVAIKIPEESNVNAKPQTVISAKQEQIQPKKAIGRIWKEQPIRQKQQQEQLQKQQQLAVVCSAEENSNKTLENAEEQHTKTLCTTITSAEAKITVTLTIARNRIATSEISKQIGENEQSKLQRVISLYEKNITKSCVKNETQKSKNTTMNETTKTMPLITTKSPIVMTISPTTVSPTNKPIIASTKITEITTEFERESGTSFSLLTSKSDTSNQSSPVFVHGFDIRKQLLTLQRQTENKKNSDCSLYNNDNNAVNLINYNGCNCEGKNKVDIISPGDFADLSILPSSSISEKKDDTKNNMSVSSNNSCLVSTIRETNYKGTWKENDRTNNYPSEKWVIEHRAQFTDGSAIVTPQSDEIADAKLALQCEQQQLLELQRELQQRQQHYYNENNKKSCQPITEKRQPALGKIASAPRNATVPIILSSHKPLSPSQLYNEFLSDKTATKLQCSQQQTTQRLKEETDDHRKRHHSTALNYCLTHSNTTSPTFLWRNTADTEAVKYLQRSLSHRQFQNRNGFSTSTFAKKDRHKWGSFYDETRLKHYDPIADMGFIDNWQDMQNRLLRSDSPISRTGIANTNRNNISDTKTEREIEKRLNDQLLQRHGYSPNSGPSLQNKMERLDALLQEFSYDANTLSSPGANVATRAFSVQPQSKTPAIKQGVGRSRSSSSHRVRSWKLARPVTRTCTALFNFMPQSVKEIAFRHGDVLRVHRQIDANWLEGERDGRIGVFPINYVQLNDENNGPVTLRALFKFTPINPNEIPLSQGETVERIRNIDPYWIEGRNQCGHVGIFPSSYVAFVHNNDEANNEIDINDTLLPPTRPKTPMLPDGQNVPSFSLSTSSSLENNNKVENQPAATPRIHTKSTTPAALPLTVTPLYGNRSQSAGNLNFGRRVAESAETLWSKDESSSAESSLFSASTRKVTLAVEPKTGTATNSPTIPLTDPLVTRILAGSPTTAFSASLIPPPLASWLCDTQLKRQHRGRSVDTVDAAPKICHKKAQRDFGHSLKSEKYCSLYSYDPQHDDELQLFEGDVIHVVRKCDDGWFIGTQERTGQFGTFPGNYATRV